MTIFSTILGWVIGGLLLPFTAILRLVGLLLPPCSSLGIVKFADSVVNMMAQIIRFGWPLLKFLPWATLWGMISVFLLYWFFLFLWRLLPTLLKIGPGVWGIILAVYVVSFVYAFALNPLNAFKAADALAGGNTEVVTAGAGTLHFNYRCDLVTPCRDIDGNAIDWTDVGTYGNFISGETSAPRWQFWDTASSTWDVFNP
jgi:hypothetical protein